MGSSINKASSENKAFLWFSDIHSSSVLLISHVDRFFYLTGIWSMEIICWIAGVCWKSDIFWSSYIDFTGRYQHCWTFSIYSHHLLQYITYFYYFWWFFFDMVPLFTPLTFSPLPFSWYSSVIYFSLYLFNVFSDSNF